MCKWASVLPSCVGCCQRDSIMSHLIQSPEVICMTGRLGEKRSSAARAQNSSKVCGSYEVLYGLHREACPWPSGNALPDDPGPCQLAHWHSQCSACLPPTHTHTPWQQPVHALEGDACELLETASEYAQKAGPTLWDWKRAHKFEHLALPYRKQVGGCQHPPFFYKIKRRHTILRTPTPPQEGTRSVEQDCP